MANNESWTKIFSDYKIKEHSFDTMPFYLSAEQIKKSCHDFKKLLKKKSEFYVNKIQEKIDHRYLLIITCSYYL